MASPSPAARPTSPRPATSAGRCAPRTPSLYTECTDNNGDPSPIQDFGGTSQSSPLTAGAAALVIEAYEQTHHGVRPSPAVVKQILTSTATDLGHPAYEQGAGLVNSLKAVQAAQSWQDGNGHPTPTGSALIVDNTQLFSTGEPGSQVTNTLTVTNVSGRPQKVDAAVRTLGRTVSDHSGTAQLDAGSAATPTFIDIGGQVRELRAAAVHRRQGGGSPHGLGGRRSPDGAPAVHHGPRRADRSEWFLRRILGTARAFKPQSG